MHSKSAKRSRTHSASQYVDKLRGVVIRAEMLQAVVDETLGDPRRSETPGLRSFPLPRPDSTRMVDVHAHQFNCHIRISLDKCLKDVVMFLISIDERPLA